MNALLQREPEERCQFAHDGPPVTLVLRRVGETTECTVVIDDVTLTVRWQLARTDHGIQLLERWYADSFAGIRLSALDERFARTLMAQAADRLPNLTHFCRRQTAAALRLATAT